MAVERRNAVMAILPGDAKPGARNVSSFIDVAALGQKRVGDRVRLYRKLRNMTQDDLAHAAEITQVDVSRLETNPSKSPLRVFVAVCAALKISVADLLEDEPIVVDGSIRPADVSREV